MNLEKFSNLTEVITIEEFNLLLDYFIDNKKNYNSIESIEILEILGEKYSKFYGTYCLSKRQKSCLLEILIALTDFSNLDTLQSLTFILYSFEIKEFFHYLKKHINTIINENVRNDLIDSLNEYEKMETAKTKL